MQQATEAADSGLSLPGLHHVTAIAGDPQRNLDFYTGVLGLRLVKVTVNFDDPRVYHLYYGAGAGTPGTILTFFPWPRVKQGRQGAGQAAAVALAIPATALGPWIERLIGRGVRFTGPARRFGEQVLAFRDPDGLALELVAVGEESAGDGWAGGAVPAEQAIRGLHSVTLWAAAIDETAAFLNGTLGFRPEAEEGGVRRYATGGGGAGALLDVRPTPGFWPGVVAGGTIHHVAWRAPDDGRQRAWRDLVAARGGDVTPVRDRHYFRSIYFHEPGGALFEIATDPPGFAVDEPVERLGSGLRLPPHLEAQRDEIAGRLPPLRLPGAVGGGASDT